jgi:alpha-galactosidase
MEGKGSIQMLSDLINDNMTESKYSHWLDENGDFKVRDDIKVFIPEKGPDYIKALTVGGFGVPDNRFGPELEFGRMVGDSYSGGMTLLIKVCWGGKDLGVDFRPPSRGRLNIYTTWYPNREGKEKEEFPWVVDEAYGKNYRTTVESVKTVLGRIESGEIYGEKLTTWDLKGLLWWQGWNDLIYTEKVEEYEENLKALVRDLRIDLNETALPVVIGELGQWGVSPHSGLRGNMLNLRRSQRAVALSDEFRGTTRAVSTAAYYVEKGHSYDGDYHYNGRADTFYQVGQTFGLTMLQLLEDIENADPESEG